MDVRSIIKEAVTRINLVPRRQAIPGDIQETAYQLLKGIVNKYNYDNLLNFTQNSILVKNSEITHIYDEDDIVKGKNNMYFPSLPALNAYEPSSEDYENGVWAMVEGNPDTVYIVYSPALNVYAWHSQTIYNDNSQRIQTMRNYIKMNHVQVRDVAKINSVYLVTPENEPFNLYREMEFVPASRFDNYTYNSPVYTVIEKSEGEWLMMIKPGIAMLNKRIKINYNESLDFDIDSDLYIPDNYTELLIVALAHKLALQYPRLDDAQMARLEQEVRVLVDNIRTPKAITRMVIRNNYDYYGDRTMTTHELLTGPWL
jgi:hypothetical protein